MTIETDSISLMNAYAEYAMQRVHSLIDENILLLSQLNIANTKIKELNTIVDNTLSTETV